MGQARAIVPADGIRAGYNETGSTISAARFVKKVAGSTVDSVALAGDGENVHGVTMDDIAALARGDIQTTGLAVMTAGAAVARGAEVTADANGKAITAVSGDYIAGIANSAASADADTFEVELVGPTSGRIKA